MPPERAEAGVDGEDLAAVRRDLEQARRLAPAPHAALVAFPGRSDEATARFHEERSHTLVLHAVRGDGSPSTD